MKPREWYEKRLEGYSGNQKDIIRLLLDIRELLTFFTGHVEIKFKELTEKQ